MVAIMTALPLFWGEDGIGAVLNGGDQRAPVIRFLAKHHDLVPVDTLDPLHLAKADLLILAQPRLLSPQELVALDTWVRRGGKVLILADPELHWPTQLPLGDPRRPPPVTLLDPLFAHWGIELMPVQPDNAEVELGNAKMLIPIAGRWETTGTFCQASALAVLLECRIGNGRAILFGDADFLAGEDGDGQSADRDDVLLHLVRIASR